MQLNRSLSLKHIPLAAALVLCACGPSTTQEATPQILGGEPLGPENGFSELLLSTVALVTESGLRSGHAHCTGTLIHPRVVLTAAHCLAAPSLSGWDVWFDNGNGRVVLGNKVARETPSIKVTAAVIHPEFRLWQIGKRNPDKVPNDIGLILLAQDAPAEMRPATLYSGDLSVGDFIRAAGYGMTKGEIWDDSGRARSVQVPLSRIDHSFHRLHIHTAGKGHCHGDSGGPAYVEKEGTWQVAGVVSDGVDFLFTCTGEGWYTDVRAYLPWIEEVKTSLLATQTES